MTASKTKATMAKASAAKKSSSKAKSSPAKETQTRSDAMSAELEASTPELLESLPKPSPRCEPKAINSTQAAAMLAGGVVLGRALGWM